MFSRFKSNSSKKMAPPPPPPLSSPPDIPAPPVPIGGAAQQEVAMGQPPRDNLDGLKKVQSNPDFADAENARLGSEKMGENYKYTDDDFIYDDPWRDPEQIFKDLVAGDANQLSLADNAYTSVEVPAYAQGMVTDLSPTGGYLQPQSPTNQKVRKELIKPKQAPPPPPVAKTTSTSDQSEVLSPSTVKSSPPSARAQLDSDVKSPPVPLATTGEGNQTASAEMTSKGIVKQFQYPPSPKPIPAKKPDTLKRPQQSVKRPLPSEPVVAKPTISMLPSPSSGSGPNLQLLAGDCLDRVDQGNTATLKKLVSRFVNRCQSFMNGTKGMSKEFKWDDFTLTSKNGKITPCCVTPTAAFYKSELKKLKSSALVNDGEAPPSTLLMVTVSGSSLDCRNIPHHAFLPKSPQFNTRLPAGMLAEPIFESCILYESADGSREEKPSQQDLGEEVDCVVTVLSDSKKSLLVTLTDCLLNAAEKYKWTLAGGDLAYIFYQMVQAEKHAILKSQVFRLSLEDTLVQRGTDGYARVLYEPGLLANKGSFASVSFDVPRFVEIFDQALSNVSPKVSGKVAEYFQKVGAALKSQNTEPPSSDFTGALFGLRLWGPGIEEFERSIKSSQPTEDLLQMWIVMARSHAIQSSACSGGISSSFECDKAEFLANLSSNVLLKACKAIYGGNV